MPFSSITVPYEQTGYFSKLVTDYLEEKPGLRKFYRYSPVHPDFDDIISTRRQFPVNRELLVSELRRQYEALDTSDRVSFNIEKLADPDTFTVCTAHQPNIFTGYLYFIYKLMQTIRLADDLKGKYPALHFVPVYVMGSEDADLNELNRISIGGRMLTWDTPQTGAVGRMNTEGLDRLIGEIRESAGSGVHAAALLDMLEKAYLGQADIRKATLWLVNALLGRYGLVVLVPDSPGFKRQILPLMREELFISPSRRIIGSTTDQLSAEYPVQAKPREINLFYLEEKIRERILKTAGDWQVMNTSISFSARELEKELDLHPERFSPNVILRGLMQEALLPNLAFIGGGGELSYWLELQGLFAHFNISYPLLLLRNSVLWIDRQDRARLEKLGISPGEIFTPEEQLVSGFVRRNAATDLELSAERAITDQLFSRLQAQAASIDPTLAGSVLAQRARAMKLLDHVALRFLRAQKEKMILRTAQIRTLREKLFPGNSLQERTENMIPYYTRYGPLFLDTLYSLLDPLSCRFTLLLET